MTLRKKVTQYKNCHNAECLVLFIVMLNIIVLNVVELTMLNVVVPYCEPIEPNKP